ncbi:hypothetical protein [Halegenticoccus tardaugens]|uniref:hypothetical protein n=1 Tax=Halegenticoccus tardaugens TaxID=2071624 RepID=UPI001E38A26B|nr:hypothetical protein [Halegenticoccus tardaugens]
MGAHNDSSVARSVQFVAFWLAVILPLALLALVAVGLPRGWLSVFLGLLALNAVALAAGHGYGR